MRPLWREGFHHPTCDYGIGHGLDQHHVGDGTVEFSASAVVARLDAEFTVDL